MNATHLHLLLNHVPVLGTVFGLGLLAFGMWRKSSELQKAALEQIRHTGFRPNAAPFKATQSKDRD